MTSNSEVPDLVARARARTDAWPIIDGAHRSFLGQLGAIDLALANQGITQTDAERRRQALTKDHVAWLHRIANAPEPQLYGLLNPPVPVVEITRTARACRAIDYARSQAVELSSPRLGMIEAKPRAKIDSMLRQMLADLAPEISASLRAEIEVFETAAPESASTT